MPPGMDIQGVQVIAARQGPRRKPQRSCTRTGTGSTRPTSRWWRRRRIKKLRAARKRGDQRRRSVKLPRALEGVQVRHALPGRRPSRSHRSRAAHKMVRATRTDGRRDIRTRGVHACVLSYLMGWGGQECPRAWARRGSPPHRLLKQRERVPSQPASLMPRESLGNAWRGPGWYVPARNASDSQRTPLWRTENTRAHLSPPSGPTLPLESQVASTDSNTPPPCQFTKAICRPTA
jgi:hypothetical protein